MTSTRTRTAFDENPTDRQGRPITCLHSWHYEADQLPPCRMDKEDHPCQGETVQCGKGLAPCERHAMRRENVESAKRQGVGSALPAFAESLSVGSKLDNGATVLRSELIASDTHSARYVVLALVHGSEFVTWSVDVNPTSGIAIAFWGHYFNTDLPAALADFDARVAA